MEKKIKYETLFTLRKDGRYQCYWKGQGGKRHAIYDPDLEKLYHKIDAKEDPPVLTFRATTEA